jgi:serine/threonine-protein kinase RsbT
MINRAIGIKMEADIYFSQNEADQIADELGFDSLDRSRIRIIVSELATNILKYANSGSIKLSGIEDNGQNGIKIESYDRGPGIEDINTALTDNYSSSGTLGLGLPGIKRIAKVMEIKSSPEEGTYVLVKYFKR